MSNFWKDGKSYAPEYWTEVANACKRKWVAEAKKGNHGEALAYWYAMNVSKAMKTAAPFGPDNTMQALLDVATLGSGALTVKGVMRGIKLLQGARVVQQSAHATKALSNLARVVPKWNKTLTLKNGVQLPSPRRTFKAGAVAVRGPVSLQRNKPAKQGARLPVPPSPRQQGRQLVKQGAVTRNSAKPVAKPLNQLQLIGRALGPPKPKNQLQLLNEALSRKPKRRTLRPAGRFIVPKLKPPVVPLTIKPPAKPLSPAQLARLRQGIGSLGNRGRSGVRPGGYPRRSSTAPVPRPIPKRPPVPPQNPIFRHLRGGR